MVAKINIKLKFIILNLYFVASNVNLELFDNCDEHKLSTIDYVPLSVTVDEVDIVDNVIKMHYPGNKNSIILMQSYFFLV